MDCELVPHVMIEEGSVRQHADGRVTGVIYWQIGDHVFPDNSWDDFVVVILAWWAQAVLRLVEQNTGEVVLYFMEGPVEVDLHMRDGLLFCEFIRRAEERQVQHAIQCSFRKFLRSFIEVLDGVLTLCRSFQSPTREIEQYILAMTLLRTRTTELLLDKDNCQ